MLDKWKAFCSLAGHLQNGSHTVVKLFQDDATRTCFIQVGKKDYYRDGQGFDAALEEALKDRKD